MSGACTSYVSAEQEVVRGFSCPRPGGEAAAVFCCGFRDPNVGALVGLSVAAVVLLAFIITACVLCYLFISSKPHTKLDPGLSLQITGPEEVPADCQCANTGFAVELPGASHLGQSYPFLNPRLESNEGQTVDAEHLLQPHFMAAVTASNIPGSPEETPVSNPDSCGPVP
ncbi:Membrane protein FAM159A [Tupaia chinensis]|uniref:Membrane protein FAM159A n=1 Tax=Tupaia chinensis TaxID=246437 RepID=L9KRY9_TUPCH|nr:Membrane protein FAM159A [Tupaia chinensis]